MADNDTGMLRVIYKFLTDEPFRCQVLYKEWTTLTKVEKLNVMQAGSLLSLHPETVWEKLREDLAPAQQAMIDRASEIAKIRTLTPAAIMDLVAADALLYGEGEVHLRSVEPEVVTGTTSHTFEIRGQGFGPRAGIEVEFVHTTGETKTATIGTTSCDPDILQRVQVTANLTLTGMWTIRGRNTSEQWGTDTVTVEVE